MLTVRNIPDDVHRALKAIAAQHGQSTEAEVREILANAVRPEARIFIGDELAAIGRKMELSNEDLDALDQTRDRKPAKPLDLK